MKKRWFAVLVPYLTVIVAFAQEPTEKLPALKGGTEEKALLQRYTHELNNQEDKLESVRAEMTKLESQRSQSRQQLDHMLQDLTLDEAI